MNSATRLGQPDNYSSPVKATRQTTEILPAACHEDLFAVQQEKPEIFLERLWLCL